ncbi:MAG TPA: 3-isopropylmalate dehydratase small subunit [Burkholderiaceae bacterium]|jgi:3-isopropylmalate/(R)-2-methylmalate dehydratase small subunit
MQPFLSLDAIALPLPAANINTDQIIPARFLRKERADGFGQFLFHDLRFDDDGHERGEFALNRPPWRDAQIIVAGANFGCGSSREMAVWAIGDYGVRAVISSRFADIFFNNCVRNGVLCVVLPQEIVTRLLDALERRPGTRLAIDLERQTVTEAPGLVHAFEVDPFHKKCLLQGLDGIDYTLKFADRIKEFEARR